MRYTEARELVEAALEQLGEETPIGRRARKSEEYFRKSFEKAKKAGKGKRISYDHERPSTPEDTAAWYRSQPSRSDGLREPVPYVGWKPR